MLYVNKIVKNEPVKPVEKPQENEKQEQTAKKPGRKTKE